MHENSDFMMKINEINVELSGNSQRYVNECCESESDGKIDGFGTGCCKCRGGVAIAMWCCMPIGGSSISRGIHRFLGAPY
jgi:hypothetical protein